MEEEGEENLALQDINKLRKQLKNLLVVRVFLTHTVLSLYNTSYFTELGIKWACCGATIFLTWNFTKKLEENDH